jgi:nucleoid-associated protein YgaU
MVDGLKVAVDDDVATISGKTTSQELREKIVLAAGNTEGIAGVDDRLVVEQPEPPARYYTVVRGDTLSKIAKAY